MTRGGHPRDSAGPDPDPVSENRPGKALGRSLGPSGSAPPPGARASVRKSEPHRAHHHPCSFLSLEERRPFGPALFGFLGRFGGLGSRAMESETAEIEIDASPADVWAVAGDFGGLVWMPGIEECTVDGDVRTISMMGMEIKEQLRSRDDAARSIAYSIIDDITWGDKLVPKSPTETTMTIVKALEEAKTHVGTDIPTVILMRTNMGCGVDFMMGTHAWHGKAPNKEQLDKGLSQLVSSLDDFVYNENYSAPNHKH